MNANGWNGAEIKVGQIVRVWDKETTGPRGVLKGVVSELHGNWAMVTITSASRTTAYQAGNRITLGAWWLEPTA